MINAVSARSGDAVALNVSLSSAKSSASPVKPLDVTDASSSKAVETSPRSEALAAANARLEQGKQELTQLLGSGSGDALTAEDAARLARQIAAAAQESVSLGGSRRALLEPSLPLVSAAMHQNLSSAEVSRAYSPPGGDQ